MTRGRKPAAPAVIDTTVFVSATPPDLAKGEISMRLALEQREAAIRAVAFRLGYQLPADCTDPDMIQRDISANMRRSVEACLEVGRGLRVLKEACEHGQFTARLDVLGIDIHVAARFMQSASKFSKLPSTATLTAIGNQTKLFEMLVLDDEQIEELELTGQTGELSLDDVATMSVKELRAAVREVREEKLALERIAAERRDEIDRLKVKGRKKHHADPWPDEVAGLKDDLNTLGKVLDEALGKHLTLIDATEAAMDSLPAESDAFGGYKTVVHNLAEQIERICTLAAGLRHEFDTRLSGTIEIDKTHILTDED